MIFSSYSNYIILILIFIAIALAVLAWFLNQQIKKLKSLDKAKNQFLIITQHHLRTPLTLIKWGTDVILKGDCGQQNEKTIEIIENFKVLSNRLLNMVNEFLDITQFQLGKEIISLRPGVQILAILNEIIDELKLETKMKNVYLKLETPQKSFAVSADREKLKAGLFNIIDNAIKYTKEGGVTIKLEEGSGTIKIIIKDTGIGIAKENLKNLFNKTFERGQEAQQVFVTGRGIGLFVAKEIITAHNGKIWAESAGEGQGSTFYIELPQNQ